jgi:hypothetical protein
MSGDNEIPTVADAAAFIGGATPPEWLVPVLASFLPRIAAFQASDAAAPTRKEIKKALLDIEEAAALLWQKLKDPVVMAFLRGADTHDYFPSISTESFEEAMQRLACLALFAGNSIPEGEGRNRAEIRNAGQPRPFINARTLTARIVAVAWAEVNDVPPGLGNADAHAACNALWEAAGGEPQEGTWRRWLADARSNDGTPAAIRAELAFYRSRIEGTPRHARNRHAWKLKNIACFRHSDANDHLTSEASRRGIPRLPQKESDT